MHKLIILALLLSLASCTSADMPEPPPDAAPLAMLDVPLERPIQVAALADMPHTSPGWQTPVTLPDDAEILEFGVVESDTRTRSLSIRLTMAGAHGHKVIAGPVDVVLSRDDDVATVAVEPAALSVDGRPVVVQVWRPNIAPVNHGRLVSVWVKTRQYGRVVASAMLGNGQGRIEYMHGAVDWLEN